MNATAQNAPELDDDALVALLTRLMDERADLERRRLEATGRDSRKLGRAIRGIRREIALVLGELETRTDRAAKLIGAVGGLLPGLRDLPV